MTKETIWQHFLKTCIWVSDEKANDGANGLMIDWMRERREVASESWQCAAGLGRPAGTEWHMALAMLV